MNVYEIVTEQIIRKLEQGVVPWRQPYVSIGAPTNLVSHKPYRGINTFLLAASGYPSPYWLTFKQAKDLGGYVRKDERSTIVVFWKNLRGDDTDNPADEPEKERPRFVLRFYRIFNISQCELPAEVTAKIPKPETRQIDVPAAVEAIRAGYPNPPRFEQGSKPCYIPATDTVLLPDRSLFLSPEFYGASLFHELTHSTGHKTRLGRDGVMSQPNFGSGSYSREELTAEMGSAFLCAEAGILIPDILDNKAAYLSAWLDRLHRDSRLVVQAAAQAQRAIDYILNRVRN